ARAADVASRHRIPLVFTDYQQMVATARLDAVVIVAPDEQHYPMTMDALDAGLHVLCEKPLATTAAQARAMYERAETAGVKHMSFFALRTSLHHRYMHQLIEQGYLGTPYAAHLHLTHGFFRSDAYQWRFDQQRGTGALGDLGCYVIDLARWFVGDIARVSAHLSSLVERPHPDGQPYVPANDAASLVVAFANGAQGTIAASVVAHQAERGQLNSVVLYGSAGTLELQHTFRGSSLQGARAEEQQIGPLAIPAELWEGVDPATPTDVTTGHSVGDRAFIDAIVQDRPITPSFYDGWKVQQVIEAAFTAHDQGCAVTIPTDAARGARSAT
ncbi:MAG TPA: Gfo/Idh/MocA family oxidoreductase, partial [Acidimicrobiales bacterium]